MLPNNIPLSFLNCHLCMLGGDWGVCVTRRSDLHLCNCKARENKIVAWSVRFNFFFFFFSREKVNFMLFVLLGGVREKDRKGFV